LPFVPRLFDYHPEAIPVPYNHSNVNSDEVMYYCDGDFVSRKGIQRYDITLHPSGLPHGPQPGVTEATIGARETGELVVMVDTFIPCRWRWRRWSSRRRLSGVVAGVGTGSMAMHSGTADGLFRQSAGPLSGSRRRVDPGRKRFYLEWLRVRTPAGDAGRCLVVAESGGGSGGGTSLHR
jgi:hypothetical protein